MTEISTLKKQRVLIHKTLSALGEDQLLTIPPVRRNNIAWNLGHIVTVQQALTCGLSGLPLNVAPEYMKCYFRDTSPADWTSQPNVPKLLEELMALPDITEADYTAGKYANFQTYTTVTGVYLGSVEEAMGFNNFHEGLHFGVMLSILKELAAS